MSIALRERTGTRTGIRTVAARTRFIGARRALVVAGTAMAMTMAMAILVACGGGGADGTTTTASTGPTIPPTTTLPTSPMTYTARKIGEASAAVDVVERDADDDFVFVVRRTGLVEKWNREGGLIEVALDARKLTSVDYERGLLGLVFEKTATGWLAFTNRTDRNGDTVIDSWTVSESGVFDAESRTKILSVDQPYANHNAGDLHFGPDGMLYIALGDGGSGGDPKRNAQNMKTMLGKVIRIDVTATGYTVPPDNPWVGVEGVLPEIWSVGLRNPFRFTIDPDGGLWLGDVGQNKTEEVDYAPPVNGEVGGRMVNFGWSAYEGEARFNYDEDLAKLAPVHTPPVHSYSHGSNRCAISGGAVVPDDVIPARAGWFYFGDHCTGALVGILVDGGKVVAKDPAMTDLGNITSVRVLSNGMYVTTHDGMLYRIDIDAG